MVVTQIAILSLLEDPIDGKIPSGLLAAMTSARSHVQASTGNFFYHFQEIEDPKKIYVLGEWESISFHMDEFLKREENKEKVKSFAQWVDVRGIWTVHLDLRIKDVAVDAPVLSIARLPIPKTKRNDFTKTFNDKLHPLYPGWLTEGSLAYGWIQEPSEDVDEFVMLAPWKDIAQHQAVDVPAEEFQRYLQGEPKITHVKRVYF